MTVTVEEFARITGIVGMDLGDAWRRYKDWAAKAKEPEDIVGKLGLLGPDERSSNELDSLLAVLRKHGVSEFKQDQFGLHLKLDCSPEVVGRKGTVSPGTPFATTIDEGPAKVAPELPDLGAIEPARHDLDDVLFGAK